MSRIRIGTSGWVYNHWQEKFYPRELSREKMLNFYSQNFNTVEINNTFYQLPSKETVKSWRENVAEQFKFSIKANRYITHMKNLKDPKEPVKNLINVIRQLKENLGPILFQLSPNWHKNYERLENFLSILPEKFKYVFELRHKTWFDEEIYNLLRGKNIALCIHDFEGQLTPLKLTADFTYLRFHGPEGHYYGYYSQEALQKYSEIIKEWMQEDLKVYVYFNNDAEANAVRNAKQLKELVGIG